MGSDILLVMLVFLPVRFLESLVVLASLVVLDFVLLVGVPVILSSVVVAGLALLVLVLVVVSVVLVGVLSFHLTFNYTLKIKCFKYTSHLKYTRRYLSVLYSLSKRYFNGINKSVAI